MPSWVIKSTNFHRCDSILFDENPSENSVLIDITSIDKPINNMIHFYDGGKFYWGCPNCSTDSYLIDIIDNDLKKINYDNRF